MKNVMGKDFVCSKKSINKSVNQLINKFIIFMRLCVHLRDKVCFGNKGNSFRKRFLKRFNGSFITTPSLSGFYIVKLAGILVIYIVLQQEKYVKTFI